MVIEQVREQRVSLGCGTLILIALIVLIFSGRGDVESQIHELRFEVRNLKEAVETQTNQIKQLQQQLEKQPARQAPREKQ